MMSESSSKYGQYPESWPLSVDQKAALAARDVFDFQRPGNMDETVLRDPAVKAATRHLFDRLEGKLDSEKLVQLEKLFGQSVDVWGKAGLFTSEREAKGYKKPNFKTEEPLKNSALALAW